jgi:integrase
MANDSIAMLQLMLARGLGTQTLRRASRWRETHLLQRHFHPFLRRAGLLLIRLRDLRHTTATLLLQGFNSKVVQERLGHSNVGITLDRYSHVLPGMQREAALAMTRLFQRDPMRGPLARAK